MDKMPKDPFMLLSFINMKLRNEHTDLDELCIAMSLDRKELEEKLEAIGYSYDSGTDQFR